ncbi:hypothetical protein J6590_022797 [Homalodisca vitripennis]|nr:hypothetical protein J6590_022797 [Homalodisca vitripennis]
MRNSRQLSSLTGGRTSGHCPVGTLSCFMRRIDGPGTNRVTHCCQHDNTDKEGCSWLQGAYAQRRAALLRRPMAAHGPLSAATTLALRLGTTSQFTLTRTRHTLCFVPP